MQVMHKAPRHSLLRPSLFIVLYGLVAPHLCVVHAAGHPYPARSPQTAPEPAVTEETLTVPPVWPPVVVVEPPVDPDTELPSSPGQRPQDDAGMSPPVSPQVTEPATEKPLIERSVTTDRESLRTAASRLKLPLPLPAGHIVVTKSRRRLELFNGSTLVKSYRVALGANPSGHKQQRGDGRTPEGQFFICTRNAKDSAFHIFLGLSYPALPDAARGVNSKTISWREYQVIRQRLASRGAPLWRTRLGGWVGIHGGTGGTFAQRKAASRQSADWTAGCIALTDAEIKEIYAATRLGTPVLVRP